MSEYEELQECKYALSECINALVDYIERLEKADSMNYFGYGREVLKTAVKAWGSEQELSREVRKGYERLMYGQELTK